MSSKRSLRRSERQRRHGAAAVLNIVSLIDVFAILVFYLLANALDPDVLPVPSALRLAESEARQPPQPTLSIALGEREIRLDGRLVSRAEEGLAASPREIAELRSALRAVGPPSGREISIVADRRLPFRVLHQVMSTCAEARYAHVSLAVVEKPHGDGA